MSFICHIHNYTEYNEEWNVFSAFNPSKCTHLEQWAANCAAPGEQSWTSCWSRDSNPQPWVTSGFKSNALSTRPQLPICRSDRSIWRCDHQSQKAVSADLITDHRKQYLPIRSLIIESSICRSDHQYRFFKAFFLSCRIIYSGDTLKICRHVWPWSTKAVLSHLTMFENRVLRYRLCISMQVVLYICLLA